jgi:hypothetical protein
MVGDLDRAQEVVVVHLTHVLAWGDTVHTQVGNQVRRSGQAGATEGVRVTSAHLHICTCLCTYASVQLFAW